MDLPAKNCGFLLTLERFVLSYEQSVKSLQKVVHFSLG